MTDCDGITLARRFRDTLLREGVPVQRVFLFGSVARGTATADSDIDIAVVCEPFRSGRVEEVLTLWRARRAIDIRIEPLCLHLSDFDEPHSFAQEIQQTGVEV